MKKYINHSGGAIGSDTVWGEIGIKYGVENKHYWYKNKTPNGNTEILEEDAIEGQKKVTIAARQMGRIAQTHQVRDERLIRNWCQVKYSDSVFAITTMLSVGDEMNYGKKALIRQGKGGTGYAIQMAINENRYLTFCSDKLKVSSQPTVVFGNMLGDFDSHILKALITKPKDIVYCIF